MRSRLHRTAAYRPPTPATHYIATAGTDASNDCGDPNRPCRTIRHTLSIVSPGATISVAAGTFREGSLTISRSVSPITISSNGAGVTIVDGNAAGSVYSVTTGATTTFNRMTIQNGHATSGGGIANDGTVTLITTAISGNIADNGGGGISNGSSLRTGATLVVQSGSTISGNAANGNGGGAGIFSSGTLTVTDSTINGNSTTDHGGGISAGASTTTITNSTMSGNMAGTSGGAISNGGTVTLTNSTVSGNTASRGGGISNVGTVNAKYITIAFNGSGVQNSAGTINLQGTIVSNSTRGPDCSGIINDQGYNLSSDDSCGFTQQTSMSRTDPVLAPLAINAPSTMLTHAPKPGSPAIHAGTTFGGNAACPATDQRGTSRPDAPGACDIGAYEGVQRGAQP